MNNTDLKQISRLMDDKFAPIKETLSQHGEMLSEHGKLLKSHDTALKSIGKTLKSHGAILNSLKKDQNTMLGMLDEEQMKQRKRITKIETHLGLTPAA